MALQHPVPEEHLKAIGDITVSFALLELTMQTLAQSLLGAGQRLGQIVTAEVSFRALRALTISLYLQRNGDDERLDEFRALIKRAANAEDKRNQITHSVWAAGRVDRCITRIKTTAKEQHGIRTLFEDVSSDQLAAIAQELKVLSHDVQKFRISLIESDKASND